jgi:TetR/AcrR family transcriptional regulator, transcriptional repressor for nem operon
MTRQRIVDAASAAFRERGLAGIGLREVMSRAGLTQGGFYYHFRNKEELFREAALQSLPLGWLFEPRANAPRRMLLRRFIETYLSAKHRDQPDSGCMLAALGGEVARGTRRQRRDFGRAGAGMLAGLAPLMQGKAAAVRQQRAALLLASMAGVLTTSRILVDVRQSDALLAGARDFFVTNFCKA